MSVDFRIWGIRPLIPIAWGLFLLLLLISCDPVPAVRSMDWGDLTPPSLINQSVESDGKVTLEFDEAVDIVPGTLRLEPALNLTSEPNYPDPSNHATVSLSIGGNAVPGALYNFELTVTDAAGNDIFIVLPFYGPNPHPAHLLINEVLTKTSTNNRDSVELLVTQGGNLGGITFAAGTPSDFDGRIIFPALDVQAGDFIIVHCKPEGLPEEIDESTDKTVSGGKNASPQAWDFWLKDSSGIPDTTGIVTLATTAMGPMMDAFFYTDKVSEEGKDYRSFGTKKMMDRADQIAATGAWSKSATSIRVEDGVSSVGATATRSINRKSQPDTNSAGDWYIVPTGGLTLGAPNLDQVYVAASKR